MEQIEKKSKLHKFVELSKKVSSELQEVKISPAWFWPDLHLKLRRNFDPACEILTDEDLQALVRVSHGIESQSARRTILMLYAKAFEAKNEKRIFDARRLLDLWELGVLVLK